MKNKFDCIQAPASFAWVLIVLCISAFSFCPATAQVFEWNNGTSTLAWYDVPENWNPAGPPALDHTARFALPGSYQVWWDDITGHTRSRYLQVRNGTVRFVGSGGQWSHTVDYGVSDSNTFISDSGHLWLGDSGLTMDLISRNLFVADGQLSVTSGSRLESAYALVGAATSEGGRLSLNQGTADMEQLILGYAAGDRGWIPMTGAILNVNNNLILGRDGRGTLDAFSGSQIQTTMVTVADNIESNSGFRLFDSSNWTNAGALTIADRGTAWNEINSGSVLQTQSATLASQANSFANLAINGTGSLFSATGSLAVGFDGTALVQVSGGGWISGQTISAGNRTGSLGVVEVSDSGSRLSASGLDIGGDGNGVVEIRNQARLNAFSIGVGRGLTGSGWLSAVGSGSEIHTTNLTLGDAQSSAVRIRSGARLVSQNTEIRGQSPDSASLLIENTGSTFFNGNNLLLSGNHAKVSIRDGADVLVNGMTSLWPGVAGTPLLEIVEASFTGHGGVSIDRGTVTMESASVFTSINNGSNGMVRFTGSQATGTQFYGSILNGGTVHVDSAEASVINHDLIQNGVLQIQANSHLVVNGLFSGTGGMTGGGLLEINGTLAPGNSPASVLFDGNLFLSPFSTTMIELGGLGPGEFDQLVVTGDFQVGGELMVSLLDGHSLNAGDWYSIAETGGTRSGFWNGFGEGDLVGNFGGRDLFITYAAGNGNGIALFTAIPEPGTTAFVFALSLTMSIARRTRRRD